MLYQFATRTDGAARAATLVVLLIACSGSYESKTAGVAPKEVAGYSHSDVWIAPITKDAIAVDGGVVDLPPKLLRAIKPEYPALAMAAEIEGVVVVELLVGLRGEVLQARIIEKRATHTMEQAVLKVVSSFEFQPGTRAGSPIECKVEFPVYFAVRESSVE